MTKVLGYYFALVLGIRVKTNLVNEISQSMDELINAIR